MERGENDKQMQSISLYAAFDIYFSNALDFSLFLLFRTALGR